MRSFGQQVTPPAALWLTPPERSVFEISHWNLDTSEADPDAPGGITHQIVMLRETRVDVGVDDRDAIAGALDGVVDDPTAWVSWLFEVPDRAGCFGRPLSEVALPPGGPEGVDEGQLRHVLARIGTWASDGRYYPRWRGEGRSAPGDLSEAYVAHSLVSPSLPTEPVYALLCYSQAPRGGRYPVVETLLELTDEGLSWVPRLTLRKPSSTRPVNDIAFFTVGPVSATAPASPWQRVRDLEPGSEAWQTRYDLVERFLDVGYEQGGDAPARNREVIPAELVADCVRTGNVDLVSIFVGIAEWGVTGLPDDLEDPYLDDGQPHGWQHTVRSGKSITDYDPWGAVDGGSHGGLGIVHLDSGKLRALYLITRNELDDVSRRHRPTRMAPFDRDGNLLEWTGDLVAPDMTLEIVRDDLNFDPIRSRWALGSDECEAYRRWGHAITRDRHAQHFLIDLAAEKFVEAGLFVAEGDSSWRDVFEDPYLRVMYSAVVSSTKSSAFRSAIDRWSEDEGDIFEFASEAIRSDGGRTRGYAAHRAACLVRHFTEHGSGPGPAPGPDEVTMVHVLASPVDPDDWRPRPPTPDITEYELDPDLEQPLRLMMSDGTTEAEETSGLAWDGTLLYVAQATSRERLLAYDPTSLPATGGRTTGVGATRELSINLSGFDPEGVAFAGDGAFFVVEEEHQTIKRFQTSDGDTTMVGQWTIDLDDPEENQGLEGVDFDELTGRLYVINEIDDRRPNQRLMIFETDDDGMLRANDDGVAQLVDTELSEAFGRLSLPENLGGVVVRDDQIYLVGRNGRRDQQIMQVDTTELRQTPGYTPTVVMLAELSADRQPQGDDNDNISWRNGRMQPEGIVFTDDGRMYICADVESDGDWGALWVYRRTQA